jgi:aspartate/methionine/tyrosine aminotransferase
MAMKDYTTICSSAPSELLALIGLTNRDFIVERNLTMISRNLSLLDGFMSKHDDKFLWAAPIAGSTAFPCLKDPRLSVTKYCDELVATDGIMLLPSSVYDYGDRHFRLGFGRGNVPDILERWDASLQGKRQSIFD